MPIIRSLNTLKSRLILLFGGLILFATSIGTWLASDLAVTALRKSTGQHLEEVAIQLRDKIELDLYERYGDLQVAATIAQDHLLSENASDFTPLLNALSESFSSYAWIGLVAPDGVVLSSTDNLLKGMNVGHRPWFQAATERPFLGDAHEALLLEEKLSNPSSSPLRFVDIAVPVLSDDGKLLAVLGAHLYLDWVANMGESFLAPLQERLQSDLIVASSTGDILIGPEGTVGKPLPDSLVGAANREQAGHITTNVSGNKYLIGYSQLRDRSEYATFNWLVVVRKPAMAAFQPAADLRSTLMIAGALIAAVLMIVATYASRQTTRPLLKMAEEAGQLDPDNPDTLIRMRDDYDEVKTLSSVLRDLIQSLSEKTKQMNDLNRTLEQRVAERTKELEIANKQLEATVRTDALTDMNNRRYFFELGEVALKKAARSQTPLSAIMFDADHFKKINDTYGHAIGDKALVHLSRLATEAVRDIDILARIGGEEFAVLLENTDETKAAEVAERLRKSIDESPLPLERGNATMTISAGVATFRPGSSDDLDTLLVLADKALYAAKAGGRNRVCCYSTVEKDGASPGDEVSG